MSRDQTEDDATTRIGKLRSFLEEKAPSGGVEEIPCLVFWAGINLGTAEVDQEAIERLYQDADLVPPRELKQSLKDLASKKYGRLERVPGRKGIVK
ncbi:MAG: hypothetical protein AAB974_04015, partial [Patescibacteria group bacterium]